MARKSVETQDFLTMIRRMIKAAGKRVAVADADDLYDLVSLKTDLDKAIAEAVIGLRAAGYTWGSLGAATGTTRQAAVQKWSRLHGIGARG